MEVGVSEGDWIAGRSLAELRLRDERLIVLGIERPDGSYDGAPSFASSIEVGDIAIIYGTTTHLCELDHRPAGIEGDRADEVAVGGRAS